MRPQMRTLRCVEGLHYMNLYVKYVYGRCSNMIRIGQNPDA